TGPGGEPLSMVPGPDGMGPGPSPYPPGHPPVPREHALISLPPYVIGPPDILLVQSTKQLGEQPIAGQHLIRPDGTIGLGIYGSVHVSGMTLDMAKEAIAAQLRLTIKEYDIRNLAVD